MRESLMHDKRSYPRLDMPERGHDGYAEVTPCVRPGQVKDRENKGDCTIAEVTGNYLSLFLMSNCLTSLLEMLSAYSGTSTANGEHFAAEGSEMETTAIRDRVRDDKVRSP